MSTPKKIWMVEETCWLNHDQPSGDIPYIRADIVDELVEALKFLLACKHGEFCDHYREAERKAKAALAKARGESHD